MYQKYLNAVHAMQSGVAAMMAYSDETSPKHLRVGVNSAMCDHAALVQLLTEKGVISMPEYQERIISQMDKEVGRYERELEEKTGTKVSLH